MQLPNDGQLVDSVDVSVLHVPFFPRVVLGDVDVALVVVVESDQIPVWPPFQELSIIYCHKAATAM